MAGPDGLMAMALPRAHLSRVLVRLLYPAALQGRVLLLDKLLDLSLSRGFHCPVYRSTHHCLSIGLSCL